MGAGITFKNLTIGYRSKHQLRAVASSIHASLQEDKLTCLIGANGVGKSTLLRTLSGFQPPLDGEILIQDKPLSDYSARRMDTPQLSVQEIIGIGRSPYTGFWGTLSSADKKIVDEAIRQTGIQHLASRSITELSDGERQKVMIAKALAQQTSLIILDEPTAFLDFPSKVETLQMLRRLAHEQHKSILLSTHDVELALQIADQLWLMEENQLSIGTPQELAADGSLSRFIDRDGIRFDVEKMRVELSSTFS